MFFTQYWAQHNPESSTSWIIPSLDIHVEKWSHRLPRRGEPDLKDWEHTAPLHLISNCRPRQTRESNLKTELTTREKSKNPFKCYPQNRLNDITWFYNHIHGVDTISNTAHRNRNCSIETKPFPESSLFTRKHDVTSDMTCVGIELKSSWAKTRR